MKKILFAIFIFLSCFHAFADNNNYYKPALVGIWHTKKFGVVLYFADKENFEIRIRRTRIRSYKRNNLRKRKTPPPLIRKGNWKITGNILVTKVKNPKKKYINITKYRIQK